MSNTTASVHDDFVCGTLQIYRHKANVAIQKLDLSNHNVGDGARTLGDALKATRALCFRM